VLLGASRVQRGDDKRIYSVTGAGIAQSAYRRAGQPEFDFRQFQEIFLY
jgi:hypothetical protein